MHFNKIVWESMYSCFLDNNCALIPVNMTTCWRSARSTTDLHNNYPFSFLRISCFLSPLLSWKLNSQICQWMQRQTFKFQINKSSSHECYSRENSRNQLQDHNLTGVLPMRLGKLHHVDQLKSRWVYCCFCSQQLIWRPWGVSVWCYTISSLRSRPAGWMLALGLRGWLSPSGSPLALSSCSGPQCRHRGQGHEAGWCMMLVEG